MLYLIPFIAKKRLKRAFVNDLQKLIKGKPLDYHDWILNQYFASRANVSYKQSYDFLDKMCQQWGGKNIGSPEQGIEDYAFDFTKVAPIIMASFQTGSRKE
jgi:hypothetical protein